MQDIHSPYATVWQENVVFIAGKDSSLIMYCQLRFGIVYTNTM